MYQLQHPLTTLANPPTKASYNKQIKSKIFDYWEADLRSKALDLTSAPFFKPEFMSLRLPHPIWLAAGSNPFECRKAVIAARMLSDRYPTKVLQRHWSQNKLGYCFSLHLQSVSTVSEAPTSPLCSPSGNSCKTA